MFLIVFIAELQQGKPGVDGIVAACRIQDEFGVQNGSMMVTRCCR